MRAGDPYVVVASALLVLPSAWCGAARAADTTVSWSAPEGCPTRAELLAEVGELAPSTVLLEDVVVSVSRTGDGYVARIVTGTGARELRAPSCEVLTSVVALVVSTTMVGPASDAPAEEAAADAAEGGAPTALDVDASAETGTAADDAPVEARARPPEELRGTAATFGGGVVGPLPDVDPLVLLSVGFRTGGFEMSIAWFRAGSLDLAHEEMGALLRLGWMLALAPFEAAFHLAGQVGTSWAGGANDRTGALWASIGAGLELRVWVDEVVALSVFGDLLVPVSRTMVPIVGAPTAYDLPVVTGAFGGGVVVQIP